MSDIPLYIGINLQRIENEWKIVGDCTSSVVRKTLLYISNNDRKPYDLKILFILLSLYSFFLKIFFKHGKKVGNWDNFVVFGDLRPRVLPIFTSWIDGENFVLFWKFFKISSNWELRKNSITIGVSNSEVTSKIRGYSISRAELRYVET